MGFNELLNLPAAETSLLGQIVDCLQAQYIFHQKTCYFIKLGKCTEQTSQIVWIKTFSDIYELSDFYCDSVFERACILVKFEEDCYQILIQGFQISYKFKVWPNKFEWRHPQKITWNRENKKMISREILKYGFGEVSSLLSNTKSNKAV